MPYWKGDDSQVSRAAGRRAIARAYAMGAEVAACYQVGDHYYGAWGEADRYNITGTVHRTAFVEGFLAALPSPLRCDERGKIVEIGPPR